MFRSYFAIPVLGAAALGTVASASAFFDAAICKPPYAMDSATALYDAAEKLAKPDTSMLSAHVFTVPDEIGQDGFKSRQILFAGTSIGILIDGLQAEALAEHYHLTKERSSLFGASTKGYARALPVEEQPQPDMGTVSIIARESASLPGKTLLACEFVWKADQDALDAFEKSQKP
ncbi:hypothetical protein [Novosphingobium resinovorum]|uniref:hypothetical protein n=1 Tax=Novosphingobium resinovorum TaxID=158500 RepID=UPI002ED623D4|nr:hypothetical protein [Novosphingobium resinovorum]